MSRKILRKHGHILLQRQIGKEAVHVALRAQSLGQDMSNTLRYEPQPHGKLTGGRRVANRCDLASTFSFPKKMFHAIDCREKYLRTLGRRRSGIVMQSRNVERSGRSPSWRRRAGRAAMRTTRSVAVSRPRDEKPRRLGVTVARSVTVRPVPSAICRTRRGHVKSWRRETSPQGSFGPQRIGTRSHAAPKRPAVRRRPILLRGYRWR